MTKIETIRSSMEIVAYISQFLPLKKKSGKLFAKCPFHAEKHASFVIFPESQTFKCFGCGAGRDIIDFAKLYFKTDVRGALGILAGDTPVEAMPVLVKKDLPITRISEKAGVRYNLLFKAIPPKSALPPEGVSLAAWRKFGAAWNEDHWLLPMRNAKCEIIGLQKRFSNGRKQTVRGMHLGLFIPRVKMEGTLFLCEGASDGAALLSIGLLAVARPAALVGIDMAVEFAHLHGFEKAVIVSDSNEVGREGSKRLSERIGIENKIVLPPNGFSDIRKFLTSGIVHTTFIREATNAAH